MSYQVLARKWRPRSFRELVGQEHVARALVNGLDNDRLHHAFLFTGTRGVGKTTIARIFAKALNCEQGVSSEPCGECPTCRDVDAGRFVDLIEVDAASRTKVDDTRELLDNVQYAPGRGRFKVYLIDEVHMLSTHSFNALLKTLEEPPPHVKFLLATTDPQKLPVTVLSRCLQFNLKRLEAGQIDAYLGQVLESEGVPFEAAAVAAVAAAADGSMRDALSLLDQAIAYGGGRLQLEETRGMLGTVERRHLEELLQALADRDGERLWATITSLAEFAPDYSAVLRDLAELLHEVAIAQAVPASGEGFVAEMAGCMAPEDVQLAYEIAVQGRASLDLAPDARSGFDMALLRMLAFSPLESTGGGSATEPQARQAGGDREAAPAPAPAPRAAPPPVAEADAAPRTVRPARAPVDGPGQPPAAAPEPRGEARIAPPPPADAGVGAPEGREAPRDWNALLSRLGLRGPAAMLAANSVLVSLGPDHFRLAVDPAHGHLRTANAEDRIRTALTRLFGQAVRIDIVEGEDAGESPAARQEREAGERLSAAQLSIEQDPVVHALRRDLGATLLPESVKPLDN